MFISDFRGYTSWLKTLKDIEEKVWTAPISEGKWSISEIIAHIMNWDHYLLTEILPAVKKGEGMNFPEFDSFNKTASEYARSSVSQINLIEEAINMRESLVSEILKMSNEKINKPLPCNGLSHCPHTGEPYSLNYLIKEFIEHDTHHKQQIIKFLF